MTYEDGVRFERERIRVALLTEADLRIRFCQGEADVEHSDILREWARRLAVPEPVIQATLPAEAAPGAELQFALASSLPFDPDGCLATSLRNPLAPPGFTMALGGDGDSAAAWTWLRRRAGMEEG